MCNDFKEQNTSPRLAVTFEILTLVPLMFYKTNNCDQAHIQVFLLEEIFIFDSI